MQQMQTFPTDPFQARCAGIGNLGIVPPGMSNGAGKHFKVHGNVAFSNFNNYMQSDADARGMTRIVFNGNNTRNDFHCGADNFQTCMANEIIDNTGNYQLNFVNANGNMRYMRQPMNPSFHGDNQMQRCYIQRPQGQQARFVRVQGSKLRPNNASYRNNFNNNQQRQNKQNRRFITKGFNNNYNKAHKGSPSSHNDEFFEDEEDASSSPKRCVQQQDYRNSPEQEVGRKINSSHNKQESQQTKSNGNRNASNVDSSYNRTNKGCSSNSKGLLEPKVEYVGNSSHNLSYDDISENSEDNDDSDLRERLMRKKHDQIIKREPGELDSDEEEETQQETSNKRRSKKKLPSIVEDIPAKKHKNSDGTSSDGKGKDFKKTQRPARKDSSGKNYSKGFYSGHDDRCSPSSMSQEDGPAQVNKVHKPTCSGGRSHGSGYTDSTNQNNCCSESEVTDLKEKIKSLKQSLRETQDKLLEANVVGSKKTLRMQDEIGQLRKQLEEAAKSESELKMTLKNVEKELSAKTAELTKMSLMNEVEKQDKAKLSAEMNRTYKERLTIEVEKLRALFDVEVAKMQAYYLSPNIYEDDTSVQFSDSSASNGEVRNQAEHAPQDEMLENSPTDMEAVNINHSSRDANSHRDIPFVHTYFNPPPLTSGTMTGTPVSFFENVMAYNALIHHQHIYAQTTAAGNGSNCSPQGPISGNATHSGM